nr:unnamed protein product [Callosobruchus analis]
MNERFEAGFKKKSVRLTFSFGLRYRILTSFYTVIEIKYTVPLSSKALLLVNLPCKAVACNGVRPSASLASTSTPLVSSNTSRHSAALAAAEAAARWSGALPRLFRATTGAPASQRARHAAALPHKQARWSAVLPLRFAKRYVLPIHYQNNNIDQRLLNVSISNVNDAVEIKIQDPAEYSFNYTEEIDINKFEIMKNLLQQFDRKEMF